MSRDGIHYDLKSEDLVLDDGSVIRGNGSAYVASLSMIEGLRLTGLRNAMSAASRDAWDAEIVVAPGFDEPEHLDENHYSETGAELVYRRGELLVRAHLALEDEPESEANLKQSLRSFLARERTELRSIERSEMPGFWTVSALFAPPIRARTVGHAQALADRAIELLTVAASGGFDYETTLELARSGRSELIAGEPESEWLEVHQVPYRLEDPKGAWELCKDVAAMANANGGLILLGLKGKNRDGRDVISSVNECRRADFKTRTYRSLFSRRIHPRVERIELEFTPGSSPEDGVGIIAVPTQSEDAKPFIVHGTFIDPGVRGKHFAIPIRVGADTEYLDVGTLHARLRAGVALHSGKVAPGEAQAELRAELARRSDASVGSWLAGVLDPARAAGILVEHGRGSVSFSRPGSDSLVVSTADDGPLLGQLNRQRVLEFLESLGMKMRRTNRGDLVPGRPD